MTRIRIATGEDGKDKTTVLLGAFPVSEGDAIKAEPTGDGDAIKIRIRTDEYPRGYGKPWIARCVIKPDDPSRLANEWGEWRGRAAGKPGELEITARPNDVISFGQRHYDDDDQTIVLYARLTDGKLEQIPNREAALEALGGKRRAGCASVLAVACAVVVALLLFALAGCAGNLALGARRVDGACDTVQDMCRMGTPSGTGDTSSPYGWMCLGTNGGASATCSVPTAPMERNEAFAGQDRLVQRIKAQGPLRGRLALVDWTAASDDTTHADIMRGQIFQMGVPNDNLLVAGVVPPVFLRDYHREYGDVTVAAAPVLWARDMGSDDAVHIAGLDVLFVTGVGNSCTEGVPCDGRLWFPDSPWWADNPGRWENAFAAFATGKFILARYAGRTHDGTVTADHATTALCGHAMDYCYSVLRNENLSGIHSSNATARLGAMAFYLFQLWDTPAEVVETLNVCIEDVGAPGIDEEFGRGIVSVVCDRVKTREVRTAVESLSAYSVSPVMGEMLSGQPGFYPPTSVSLKAPALNLRPFFAFNSYNMAGHVGAGFAVRDTDLFVAGGADYMPLGLRSSLIPATRAPFAEIGAKRSLLDNLSVLGTYGHSKGHYLTANVVNVALRYSRTIRRATVTLHTGYRGVAGIIGIPGYQQAGAAKTRFLARHPDVRVSVTVQ